MFYCFDAIVNGAVFFSFQIFCYWYYINVGLPRWLSGKESACQCRRCRFDSWVERIPWRRKWQPTPVFLAENSMDRGAWQATIHGVTVRHDWACMHANINATNSAYWFYIHTFYQCIVYFPIFMSLTGIFSFQLQRTPFSVSSKASLVDSLSFCFSGKVFLLHISGVSLSDKVFLAGNFFFQWTLWICYSTLFWPVGFLLRNLLIA